jgi:hypothetical protein
VKLFGHRQTKEAATDKPNLLLPRHISTLPVCDLRDGCCARQQLLQASPVCPAVCDRVGGPSGNAPRVRKGKTTRWERSMPCRSRVSTALNLHGRPVAMSHETRQNRPGQDGGAGPGGIPRAGSGKRTTITRRGPSRPDAAPPLDRIPPGVCWAIWRAYARSCGGRRVRESLRGPSDTTTAPKGTCMGTNTLY